MGAKRRLRNYSDTQYSKSGGKRPPNSRQPNARQLWPPLSCRRPVFLALGLGCLGGDLTSALRSALASASDFAVAVIGLVRPRRLILIFGELGFRPLHCSFFGVLTFLRLRPRHHQAIACASRSRRFSLASVGGQFDHRRAIARCLEIGRLRLGRLSVGRLRVGRLGCAERTSSRAVLVKGVTRLP